MLLPIETLGAERIVGCVNRLFEAIDVVAY